MKPFYYESSDYAPRVDFNSLTGVFELEGISRPENVSAFYIDLIGWLKEYEQGWCKTGKAAETGIVLNIKLTYCNSASSKYILQATEIIVSWKKYGILPKINWYYDESDEKMKEDGQDLSDALDYSFNFVSLT